MKLIELKPVPSTVSPNHGGKEHDSFRVAHTDVKSGLIITLAVVVVSSGQTCADARALPLLRAVITVASPETVPIGKHVAKPVRKAPRTLLPSYGFVVAALVVVRD